MKQHKPDCGVNMSCLVYHPDGVCNHPTYGKCTCDGNPTNITTPSPHKGSEEKCKCGNCKKCPDCWFEGKEDNFCPVYLHATHIPLSPSKNYERVSHSHCFETQIEKRPCTLKGYHCCLCDIVTSGDSVAPSKGIENCNCTKDTWGGDDYTCSKHIAEKIRQEMMEAHDEINHPKIDVSPATLSAGQSEKCQCGVCKKCPDCYYKGKKDNFCGVYLHPPHQQETTNEKIDRWEKSAKDWQTAFDTEFLSRVYSVDDPTLGAEIVCFIAVMLSVANRQKEDWSIADEHTKARSEVLEEIIKHIRTMERGNHEYDKAISNVFYYLSGLKSKES